MSQQLQHCRKCGALQPNRPRCSVCGAKLQGAGNAAEELGSGEIIRLAALLFAGLAGIVVIGVLIMWLALTLL